MRLVITTIGWCFRLAAIAYLAVELNKIRELTLPGIRMLEALGH